MIKFTSQNKVTLVSNREKKKQWPWIFPLACLYSLEYSGFRKSAFFLISQMWMTQVHFLCFSHAENNAVYLNKPTGCLTSRGILWLPPLSAIRVITILLKTVNKLTFLYCQQTAAVWKLCLAQHITHSAESNPFRTLYDFQKDDSNDLQYAACMGFGFFFQQVITTYLIFHWIWLLIPLTNLRAFLLVLRWLTLPWMKNLWCWHQPCFISGYL